MSEAEMADAKERYHKAEAAEHQADKEKQEEPRSQTNPNPEAFPTQTLILTLIGGDTESYRGSQSLGSQETRKKCRRGLP